MSGNTAMRKLGLMVLALGSLAGCATKSPMSPTITLPDGSQGHRVDCSRSSGSWGQCYEKAGEFCGPSGFYEVERYEDARPIAGGGQGLGPNMLRTLYFRCWRYPFLSLAD